MERQIVDPFVAASRPARRPSVAAPLSPQAPAAVTSPVVQKRSRNIDGVVPAVSAPKTQPYRGPAASLHLQYVKKPQTPQAPQAQVAPAAVRPDIVAPRPRPQASGHPTAASTMVAPATTTPSVAAKTVDEPQPKSKSTKKAPKEGVSTLWLIVGAAVVGLALFSVLAGQIALAIYAIVALWRRVPSQQSFMLALVMFGGIIVASLIPPFQEVADNLAVYAFLLLCIGAISLAREVRHDMRPKAPLLRDNPRRPR